MSKTKKSKDQKQYSGFTPDKIEELLVQYRRHPVLGKWRQERKLNIPYYLAKILWTSTNKGSFEFTTPVPKGATQAFKKGQMTHCRNFESLPNLIKEKLGINSKREFAEAGLEVYVAYTGKTKLKLKI